MLQSIPIDVAMTISWSEYLTELLAWTNSSYIIPWKDTDTSVIGTASLMRVLPPCPPPQITLVIQRIRTVPVESIVADVDGIMI